MVSTPCVLVCIERLPTYAYFYIRLLYDAVEMITDLARILSDFEVDKVNKNQIESDIEEIAADINKRGGIFKKNK